MLVRPCRLSPPARLQVAALRLHRRLLLQVYPPLHASVDETRVGMCVAVIVVVVAVVAVVDVVAFVVIVVAVVVCLFSFAAFIFICCYGPENSPYRQGLALVPHFSAQPERFCGREFCL